MLADENVDCLMAANVAPTPFMENLPAGTDHKEDILHENSYPNVTIRAFKATTKPMVASLNSGRLFDPAVQMMEDAGIPCFRKIDRAMKALGFFIEHGKREA
jgi:acyl-CoA synthetase (NDP forming)